MDWPTFISTIVAALAWPATLLIFFFIIRKELPAIAKSLRRFKYKDVELEFGETAKAIAGEVKEVVPETKPNIMIAGHSKPESQARLEQFAEISPRAAILEAWLQVEAAAADVLRKKGIGLTSSFPGPLRLRESLQKGGILNPRQVAVFEQLRALRNDAVHVADAEFTKLAVASYIESAVAMASYLEGMAADF